MTQETFSADHRASNGCLCCGAQNLRQEIAVTSGFLASRAWGGQPELNQLMECQVCGFRFFDRGLSNIEATTFYQDYRSEDYFVNRRCWEPFYTRTQHQAIVATSGSPERREAIHKCLDEVGLCTAHSVLDYGGVDGYMIANLTAKRKAVFEISGIAAAKGIEAIRSEEIVGHNWHLILTCQVLEHVADPKAYLIGLLDRLADNGHLYVEVPYERWRASFTDSPLRLWWLRFLLGNKPVLIAVDTLSTVGRIKLGRIPKFGFMSMREHLNFFTRRSLEKLAEHTKSKIVATGINEAGSLYLILQKNLTHA